MEIVVNLKSHKHFTVWYLKYDGLQVLKDSKTLQCLDIENLRCQMELFEILYSLPALRSLSVDVRGLSFLYKLLDYLRNNGKSFTNVRLRIFDARFHHKYYSEFIDHCPNLDSLQLLNKAARAVQSIKYGKIFKLKKLSKLSINAPHGYDGEDIGLPPDLRLLFEWIGSKMKSLTIVDSSDKLVANVIANCPHIVDLNFEGDNSRYIQFGAC